MVMEICANGHDEIVFSGNFCPACDFLEDLNIAVKDRDKYEEELDKLQDIHEALVEKVVIHAPELII